MPCVGRDVEDAERKDEYGVVRVDLRQAMIATLIDVYDIVTKLR